MQSVTNSANKGNTRNFITILAQYFDNCISVYCVLFSIPLDLKHLHGEPGGHMEHRKDPPDGKWFASVAVSGFSSKQFQNVYQFATKVKVIIRMLLLW